MSTFLLTRSHTDLNKKLEEKIQSTLTIRILVLVSPFIPLSCLGLENLDISTEMINMDDMD